MRGARRGARRRGWDWGEPSSLRDATAAAYVGVVLDAGRGLVQSPKLEALVAGVSLVYTVLWVGGGSVWEGVEALRGASGWLVDGVGVARGLVSGLAGLPGRVAWEAVRELLEGSLAPRHWAARIVLEAIEARVGRRGLVAKWLGDPGSVGIRFFNREVDCLLDRLAELYPEGLGPAEGFVEAGRLVYGAARRIVERCPGFIEKIRGRVRAYALRGL